MKQRWLEFFEAENRVLSMTRLILLGSFVVASLLMLRLVFVDKMTEGYFTIYLTAFVTSYGVSKGADVFTSKGGKNARNPVAGK